MTRRMGAPRAPRLVVKKLPSPQSDLPKAPRMKSIRIHSALSLIRFARRAAVSPIIPQGGRGPDLQQIASKLSKGSP